jgi:hypothetical protein
MDNSTCHSGRKVTDEFDNRKLQRVAHPPYSPDLSPCDFWLFDMLKQKMKDHYASGRRPLPCFRGCCRVSRWSLSSPSFSSLSSLNSTGLSCGFSVIWNENDAIKKLNHWKIAETHREPSGRLSDPTYLSVFEHSSMRLQSVIPTERHYDEPDIMLGMVIASISFRWDLAQTIASRLRVLPIRESAFSTNGFPNISILVSGGIWIQSFPFESRSILQRIEKSDCFWRACRRFFVLSDSSQVHASESYAGLWVSTFIAAHLHQLNRSICQTCRIPFDSMIHCFIIFTFRGGQNRMWSQSHD